MKLKLADILPNPYRNLVKNPLKKEKITELENSIGDTGFWDNIVVRINSEGKPEAAYGHHRLQAAINCGIAEADFIVKEITDERMLKMMDNENRETYGADLFSLMESVEGLVNALASGAVQPFKADPKVRQDQFRYAPSFVMGKMPSEAQARPTSKKLAYTTLDVAKYFGRIRKSEEGLKPNDAILAAFTVLELEEAKVPGWSRKEILKRSLPGWAKPLNTIASRTVIKAGADAKQELRVKQSLESSHKEDNKAQAKAVESSLKQLRAEQVAEEKELKRLEKEYAESRKQANVAKAKQLKVELERKKEEDKQRDELIKQSEKEEKKIAKERAKEQEAVEFKARKKKQEAQERHVQNTDTLMGKVSRLFSEEDALLTDLKNWAKDSRSTDQQRAYMALALRDLVTRVEAVVVQKKVR